MPEPESGKPAPDPTAPTDVPPAPDAPLPTFRPHAPYTVRVDRFAATSSWTRTYDLPSARRVVSAGLQLSLGATRELRRGSIYIGLLALGALGPVVLFLVLSVARLGPETGRIMDLLATDPAVIMFAYPEVVGVVLGLELIGGLGLLLLWAVSIDAQSIAIALLAGKAGGQHVRLWEAVQRARQVFWRMLGAGVLVGIASAFVQGVATLIVASFSRGQTTAAIVAPILATIALTPFAYSASAIVLGDVGPVDALRRSWALFRARPSIALVVVLFTLVTDGIQLFALGAGADLISRAGEALHVSFTEGALAMGAAMVLLLAAIVALGSLLFTVMALVSAPQVSAFLGLTYYAGGLDRARSEGPRPRSTHWVTRPMLASMAGLLILALVIQPGSPTTAGRPVSPLVEFARQAARAHGGVAYEIGQVGRLEDPTGDVIGTSAAAADIVLVEYAFLDSVPDWLLDDVFGCGHPSVACAASTGKNHYDDGALMFLSRANAQIEAGPAGMRVAVLLGLEDEQAALRVATDHYSASSFVVEVALGPQPAMRLLRYRQQRFNPTGTQARSTWSGTDLFTLIPLDELPSRAYSWDVVTEIDGRAGAPGSRDTAREFDGGSLRDLAIVADVYFEDLPSIAP